MFLQCDFHMQTLHVKLFDCPYLSMQAIPCGIIKYAKIENQDYRHEILSPTCLFSLDTAGSVWDRHLQWGCDPKRAPQLRDSDVLSTGDHGSGK